MTMESGSRHPQATVFAVVIALLLTSTVFELVYRHADQDGRSVSADGP
jgi:hypothetical protein